MDRAPSEPGVRQPIGADADIGETAALNKATTDQTPDNSLAIVDPVDKSDRPATAKPPAKTSDRLPTSVAPKLAVLPGVTPSFWAERRMAGFSTDGSHFIYLESSRDTGAGIPLSSLQLVEVASNRCIADGCLITRYSEADADVTIADAEKDLLQKTWKLRQTLQLTPPAVGQSLPIISRSRAADGTETVTVRRENRDQPLRLRLKQKRVGSTDGTRSGDGAAMQLDVAVGNEWRSLDSLTNIRPYVLDYSIREVRLSPDGNHVAVLITATKPTFEGTLGTTLVQSLDL